MGKSREDKKQQKQSKINKLINENEKLKLEIKKLIETIDVLQRANESLWNEQERNKNKKDVNLTLHAEKCEQCGKGIMSEVVFYKIDTPYSFKKCNTCGYRTKAKPK